ncbi:MAG: phospholipid carrier-dependent glycosyltransferase [Acidobacteriaceae bacterium]
MPAAPPTRPRSTLLTILLLWIAFYASFTLFTPQLLDDADSVHAEVAREMLLRHDYVTLYANGIRYLEKAPLLYWSMAASMRASQFLGLNSPQALTVAARIPLSLSVLALVLLAEAFARRLFHSPERPQSGPRAGLYAALILLSGFGLFIFTRINIPDAGVCLFTTVAIYFFWRTEELAALASTTISHPADPVPRGFSLGSHSPEKKSGLQPPSLWHPHDRLRLYAGGFAVACALNVLTKGLIGVVFPAAIVVLYLLLTRGLRPTLHRLRELHPWSTLEAFLLIAAPWHILAGLANPTQGHPTPFRFMHGHWLVPLPTDGNVRGWYWFYFMNEHVLRYLNLRVPHDYDTSPLWLFWGLCLIWLMPWSAFAFKATTWAAPIFALRNRHSPDAQTFRTRLRNHTLPLKRRGAVLLLIWAAFVLLFFALSTRQEYYVLPALPAAAILIAGWLAQDSHATQRSSAQPNSTHPSSQPGPSTSSSSRPEAAHLAAAVERSLYSSSSPATPSVPAIAHHTGHSQVLRGFSLGSHIPEKDRGFSPSHRRAAQRCTAVLLALGSLFAAFALYILLHAHTPPPHTDLATLLTEHPSDYALSMGHFLDLDTRALGLFRLPLTLAALSLFLGPLISLILRRKSRPHAATLALAAGAFGFLLAADLGLQTFAPVLSSAQLAEAIAPQVKPQDLIVIHGEYEAGSTLAFYLQRPSTYIAPASTLAHPVAPATNFIHILQGRSSNLWYGSFFPDAPPIFETPTSIAAKWPGPQRIFLWQSLTDPPNQLPPLPGLVYILVKSGGKEIVSNQPNP